MAPSLGGDRHQVGARPHRAGLPGRWTGSQLVFVMLKCGRGAGEVPPCDLGRFELQFHVPSVEVISLELRDTGRTR